MIKHIVAWKLKPENKEENARSVKEKLEGLVGKIPGLIKAKVVRPIEKCEYDIALISKLESEEALAGYQTHPAHVEASSFVRSVIEARVCIDYVKGRERKGVITMKGNPMTLVGHELKVGDAAPDFTVLSETMAPVSLKDFDGKYKVISVTPSVDTSVCDLQIHWFNEDATNISEDVAVLNMSMDLPFALKRYCAAAGIDRAKAYSDHRAASFGKAYGVLMGELRLLARSVFVIDKENKIRYIEIIKEQTTEPNYEAAIEALKSIM